ncbi:hypothetical protein X975_14283, partial [Stegodyphus mimosarum]
MILDVYIYNQSSANDKRIIFRCHIMMCKGMTHTNICNA